MPPKQQAKISDKQKAKIVEDKTFGLKNKNKSKIVKQFVAQVQKAVDDRTKAPRGAIDEAARRKAEKEEKKAFQNELASLFTPAQQTKVPQGADPKSVICEFFRQGLCVKGAKCKFSHDLTLERKAAKIDLYTDQRDGKEEEDGMVGWDQSILEEAVTKKMNRVQTDIICKYFLDAVETRKYGWFWQCPNGNDKCIYRHALPPGFVLKADKKKLEEQQDDDRNLEEEIEEERAKITGHTPVTKETFLAWKAKREEGRAVAKAEADRKAVEAAKHKKPTCMSGRALFDFNPDLFVDDDDAAADYERDENDENVVEITEVSGTSISYGVHGGHKKGENDDEDDDNGAAAAVGDMTIQEALFLEGDVPDDLPDDDDDDDEN